MNEPVTYYSHETIAERAIIAGWVLFWILLGIGMIILLLSVPAEAIDPVINPSVENQPVLCQYSLTKWLPGACPPTKGSEGPAGINGTPGLPGQSNFSAMFWNSSNFTTTQNQSTFLNSTNFTAYSNYTIYQGASITINNGTVNESYAYLPGRTGGQTLNGGTGASDDLYLNSTTNVDKGDVLIAGDGGNVSIGAQVHSFKMTERLNVNGGITLAGDAQTHKIKADHNGGAIQITDNGGTGGDIYRNLKLGWNDNANDFHTIMTMVYDRAVNPAYSVGIGNVTPKGLFHVDSGYAGTFPTDTIYPQVTVSYPDFGGALQFLTRSTSADFILFGDERNSYRGGIVYDHRTGSEGLYFTANGSTRLGINQDGIVKINGLGAGTVMADASGNLYVVSDAKTKTNIAEYKPPSSLDKVKALSPKTFQWAKSSGLSTTETNLGFITGEVKTVIPEAVSTSQDKVCKSIATNKTFTEVCTPTGTTTDSLSDRAIIAVQILAIQELDSKVTAQQKQIDELKARLDRAGVKP